MKKFLRFFFLSALLFTSACGYKVQGLTTKNTDSILGDGSKTVAITKIEDPSLYPWVNYYVTNLFHSEMNMRRLAKWENKDKADYTIEVIMPRFESRSFLNDETDRTLLSTIYIEMEVTVRNSVTNEVWRSGVLSASEYFDNMNEESAVRENLSELIYDIFNAMENNF